MISLGGDGRGSGGSGTRPVLIAVPNAINSGAIDIFHLPLERRVSTIPAPALASSPAGSHIGMVMAVNIFFNHHSSGELFVCSGYEDGHVMAFACLGMAKQKLFEIEDGRQESWKWKMVYSSRPHKEPVLGLDVSLSKNGIFTSSADALLAVHPVPSTAIASTDSSTGSTIDLPLKVVNSKHAGQQGLRVRLDGRIFATAGWDSRIRVYSCKTMRELAVLKWHKQGCFVICFADIDAADDEAVASRDEGAPQVAMEKQQFSLATIQQQRCRKVQNTHWLVAGSKDGNISLWDIY